MDVLGLLVASAALGAPAGGRRRRRWLVGVAGASGLAAAATVVTAWLLAGGSGGPAIGGGPEPAPDPEPEPLPLGSVAASTEAVPDCPARMECSVWTVSCPGLAPARAAWAMDRADEPHGVVMFFSGGVGTQWWRHEGPPAAVAMQRDLVEGGLTVVDVRWLDPWIFPAGGGMSGPGVSACRPATLIEHAWATLDGAEEDRSEGRCGMCITGNSAGAAQVSYALGFYGLDTILDGVFPTSGPPLAALAKGCMREPGQEDYWYTEDEASLIDASFGFREGGPCRGHDAAWQAAWDAASVDTGALDLCHPRTRVHFLFGADDSSVSVPHGRDYADRLEECTPASQQETVAGMDHSVIESEAGLARLRALLLA